MITYNRNTAISELKSQSVQGLELLCPTANCRQKVAIPITQFPDDLTLDIIHWTTSCSVCGRSEVYATPMLVLTDSNAVLEAPTRLAYEDPATRQEITQGIMHLCQLYPDYVERRAVQMAKDQLAKTKNQSWSELSLTDQTSIIENNEAEIMEGHFLKLGKFFISAALGIPAFL